MFDEILILSLLALGQGADNGPQDESLRSKAATRFGSWTEKQWLELLDRADRYEVLGLVIDGASMLHSWEESGVKLPRKVIMQISSDLEHLESRAKGTADAAEELLSMLRARNFHPVLMKGPAIGMYYPQPLHRQCGDIDVFLPSEEFDAAVPPDAVKCSDGSIQYKWITPTCGFDIEHHRKLFDCKEQFGSTAGLPELDPESTEGKLLMESAHILKHCFGFGIGLKQIFDYMVLRRMVSRDKRAEERFEKALGKAALVKWNRLLDQFTQNPFDDDNPLRKKLQSSTHGRTSRVRTGLSFVKTIPFGMKYAPKEWFNTVFSLL